MEQQTTLPDEDAVSEAVARWLRQRGFNVNVLSDRRPGLDITAHHPDNAQKWVIEAKGGTSSKPGSRAYGINYGQNGAYRGTAEAFWMATQWTSQERFRDHNIGFAIPEAKHFDNHSRPLESACRLLGIAIFRVAPDLTVRVFPEELERIGNGRFKRPTELLSGVSNETDAR